MFKVNDRNTRTRWEICSELTIKTPERCQWRHSGVFIVNFEHISHLVLVFLSLTLNKQTLTGTMIGAYFPMDSINGFCIQNINYHNTTPFNLLV